MAGERSAIYVKNSSFPLECPPGALFPFMVNVYYDPAVNNDPLDAFTCRIVYESGPGPVEAGFLNTIDGVFHPSTEYMNVGGVGICNDRPTCDFLHIDSFVWHGSFWGCGGNFTDSVIGWKWGVKYPFILKAPNLTGTMRFRIIPATIRNGILIPYEDKSIRVEVQIRNGATVPQVYTLENPRCVPPSVQDGGSYEIATGIRCTTPGGNVQITAFHASKTGRLLWDWPQTVAMNGQTYVDFKWPHPLVAHVDNGCWEPSPPTCPDWSYIFKSGGNKIVIVVVPV